MRTIDKGKEKGGTSQRVHASTASGGRAAADLEQKTLSYGIQVNIMILSRMQRCKMAIKLFRWTLHDETFGVP